LRIENKDRPFSIFNSQFFIHDMLRYAQVTVEGRPIHYATEGQGAPLLLLHGPPFNHQVWASTIPYLAGRFRVVAPDMPGYGRSPPLAGDDSPEALIRLTAGLMTALRMVPGFVAGASFGGAVALGLAARHPERVRGLVAVSALGIQRWPGTFQARLARAARGLPGALALGMRLAPRAQARWFLRGALGDRRAADGAVVEQVAATLRSTTSRRALIRALRRLDDWRFVTRQLGGIRAPTLLVWGERDALYGLPVAERMRHAIHGARLVTLAGAGHLLPVERPEELAAAMRGFLLPLAR
jgi:pimeloyl-ACP methyl ester carboxylesterase